MFALANRRSAHKKGVRSVLKVLVVILILCEINSNALLTSIYGATVTQGTVKARSGYVRSDSSASSSVAFCVSSNEQVAILGEEKGKDGNTWYKIAVGESTGYIRSDLVTKTDKKITVKDSLVKDVKDQNSKTTNKNADSTDKNQSSQQTSSAASNTSSGNVGTVKGTYVRLRKSASTTSGIEKVLNIGDIVNIVGEGKASDGQIWYQVKIDGATGFIRSDLVDKPNNTSTNSDSASNSTNTTDSKNEVTSVTLNSAAEREGTVKGTSVRIRDAAGLVSNVVTTVDTGAKITVVGSKSAAERNWYKIKATVNGKNIEGYIAADFVTLTEVVNNEEKKEEVENTEEKKTEEEVKREESEAMQKVLASAASSNSANASGAASIKGVGVRVREVPVTGNVLCQLSSGYPLNIVDSKDGEDGYKWYQVNFSYQGNAKTGYVRNDFVSIAAEEAKEAPMGDEEFEASISSFPDDYKNALRKLHAAHPYWRFEAVNTGLDWQASLNAESSVGKNLVSKNSVASWKSTAPQAYDWNSNTWYTFDGGSWASASPELIAYYMDPRNFLNESGIYQFETLDYSDNQSRDGVAKMLTGTFMSGDFVDTDGTTYNYADVFMNMASLTGVSPYLLAGRCLQEQGVKGASQSISGFVPGYEGYFNYFNIGAYAYSGRTATINGLIYAKTGDESNMRPWNSRLKSIYGGAKYVADKFVSKGQNTLYFQKFNVVNSENTLYSHQYMTNIQAASSESARLQLAYLGNDEAIKFRIPVYGNMPSIPCEKPTSDSNPNTYLSYISIDGYELTPAFSGVTENYVVNVDSNAESITINAAAVSPTSAVGGTGTYPINPGTNTLYVGCKSQSGAIKVYTLTVQR